MRIQQRQPGSDQYLLSSITVTRGTNVTFTGGATIFAQGGMFLISARLVLVSPPGTGTWNFTLAELSGRVSDQIFGQLGVIGTGTGAVPARISATGVITPVGTLPEPGNGGIVTITGMVF